MNTRLLSRLTVLALVFLVLASVLTAAAAANFVPVTRADDQNLGAPTANQLKPPQCTMALTNIVRCTGTGICRGTSDNDLILGTTGSDTGPTRIVGGNGDDCILGGAGDDDLRGQGGNNDVCIGGPGTDTFNNTCETQIQ